MKRALLLLGVLVLLAPACMPSADEFKFACTGDAQCGDGWVCVKGLCAAISELPTCDQGAELCNGECCQPGEECVESAEGKDRCCVLDVAVHCINGEDLYHVDSCGDVGARVTECPGGCSQQTHECQTCTPDCLRPDGVSVKECGTDSCNGATCGDCGGVPAHGVCVDDYKCDCNANARCAQPDGRVLCCGPGESCVEGSCQSL
jgi:hypothetical protein